MKQSSKLSTGWQNWLLLAGVVALAIAPLILIKDAEFAGADEQAGEAIAASHPDYKPWFQPLFEPASGEIASLLFATQAALGAGVIGYVVGLSKGRSQNNSPNHLSDQSEDENKA